ncbi:hypothetical protein PGT21_026402 [Puccinia graminis f. sp. tritici]|uniref:Uncharacterized protein n=1 Tax=Puccinia graminis f. sp. tritici TaxID=56615 RepID=A0A5B0MWG0_PUCGR|nr:hypothetical protein PGT21_026402 [Puccinia graminis f. sp. tritici]KAA1131119.1 hypothetical protein PGTUg99_010916 [Puccinia graminis f. sp. tritici]
MKPFTESLPPLVYLYLHLITSALPGGVLSEFKKPGSPGQGNNNLGNLRSVLLDFTLSNSHVTPHPTGSGCNTGGGKNSDTSTAADLTQARANGLSCRISSDPGISSEMKGNRRKFDDMTNATPSSSSHRSKRGRTNLTHKHTENHVAPSMELKQNSGDNFSGPHLDLDLSLCCSTTPPKKQKSSACNGFSALDFSGWNIPSSMDKEQPMGNTGIIQKDSISSFGLFLDNPKRLELENNHHKEYLINPIHTKQSSSSSHGFMGKEFTSLMHSNGINKDNENPGNISQIGTQLHIFPGDLSFKTFKEATLRNVLNSPPKLAISTHNLLDKTHYAMTSNTNSENLNLLKTDVWFQDSQQKKLSEKLNKGKNKEVENLNTEQLHYKSNEMIDWRMIAWIFGMTNYDINPAQLDLKSSNNFIILLFIESLNAILNQKPQIKIKEEQRLKVVEYEHITQFAHTLWLIHMQFVQSIGSCSKPEGFVKDHISLQDWLISNLRNLQPKLRTILFLSSTGHDYAQTQYDFNFFPNFVQELSKISSMTKNKTFHLLGDIKNDSSFWGAASEVQLIITKLVMNMIHFYYVSSNINKWIFLFPTETHFVYHLAKNQVPHSLQNQILRSSIDKHRAEVFDLNLMPWIDSLNPNHKNPFIEDETAYKEMSDLIHHQVKLISKEDLHSLTFVQTSLSTIYSSTLGQSAIELKWKNLSRMASKIGGFHSPLIHTEYQKLRYFIGSLGIFKIFEKLQTILKLVWGFNARLIEIFGYDHDWRDNHIILEDQRQIQQEFFNILLEPHLKKHTSIGFQKEPITEHHPILRSEVRKMIYESLFSMSSPDLTLTSQNIIFKERIFKTVIKIINYYYQSKNFTKWLIVFKDEGRLEKAFEKISRKMEQFDNNSLNFPLNYNQVHKLRLTGLFPWKYSPLTTTEKQREEFNLLFLS